MIYAPDGTIATKDIVPMTWQHLGWLNDGHLFLRHLHELCALRLEVVCHPCHMKGHRDGIAIHVLEPQRLYLATCGHAERRIPFAGVTSGDELRELYRWALRCRASGVDVQDCERRGMHYWIDAPNAPTSKELHLTCGCTDRIYKMTRSVN